MKTIGDVREAIDAVLSIKNDRLARQHARIFMDAYRLVTVHAASNVGYLAGYYDRKTMARIFDLFECAHPIFGTRTDLEPDELLSLGKRWMADD